MDPYQILGITPAATDDELRTTYRTLVKKYHPDRYANVPAEMQEKASERVKQINAAYDEVKRIRAGGSASGAYGHSSSGTQGGYASGEQFADIREMIQRGLIMQADAALSRIQNHTAEWYYLTGVVNMRQGRYSTAQQAFQTAANMDPGNPEYRQAAEQMQGVYQQTRARTGRAPNGALCNICQCLACASFCSGGRCLFCC